MRDVSTVDQVFHRRVNLEGHLLATDDLVLDLLKGVPLFDPRSVMTTDH